MTRRTREGRGVRDLRLYKLDPEELPHPRRQILCNIPLDLPIDELVTWNQLTGDRRLCDALAE